MENFLWQQVEFVGGKKRDRKFAQTDLKIEKPGLVTYEHTFL